MEKEVIYAKLSNLPRDLTIIDFQGDGEVETYLRRTYERFITLSVEVTAFTQFDLQGTGQGKSYYVTVSQIVGWEIMEQLLDTFDLIVSEAEGQSKSVRKDLLYQSLFGDEKLGPIVRNIIKLWFIGNWYQLPRDWSEKFGPVARDVTFTVSPAAYVEGLLWTTIGAHPAGAKAQGYGSWANKPQIPSIHAEKR